MLGLSRFRRPPEVPLPPRRPARHRPPPLLHAKLAPPNLEPSVLERRTLLEQLARHAGCPLTLLTADAGWGKSVLAPAFARRVHRPVIWYSLLPSDADLRVLGRHLLAGVRRDAPRFGATFARLLEVAKPGPRGAETLPEPFVQDATGLTGPPPLPLPPA